MKTCLIVSKSEKAASFFSGMLRQDGYESIHISQTAIEARQYLSQQEADLCIIDVPLRDESGSSLAIDVAENPACQVILTIKAQFYQEAAQQMEEYGVFTVEKPMNPDAFWTALKMTDVMHVRYQRIQEENTKLLRKIEDMRIVNRAKLTLMTYLNMTENEAHRYIEKHAMDQRLTRRKVAEKILKTYK